jgi:hypothetical protein
MTPVLVNEAEGWAVAVDALIETATTSRLTTRMPCICSFGYRVGTGVPLIFQFDKRERV